VWWECGGGIQIVHDERWECGKGVQVVCDEWWECGGSVVGVYKLCVCVMSGGSVVGAWWGVHVVCDE